MSHLGKGFGRLTLPRHPVLSPEELMCMLGSADEVLDMQMYCGAG